MDDQIGDGKDGFLAAGAALAAVLASSCCILPLVLVTAGISGAWIGNLTAIEPYKWALIAGAAALLGIGFYHAYFRQAPPCDDNAYCARPGAGLFVKSALWLGAFLIASSATVDWWAPLFY